MTDSVQLAPVSRSSWLGFYRPPASIRAALARGAWRLGEWLGPGIWRWLLTGLLIGTVSPWWFGAEAWPLFHGLRAVGLAAILAAATLRDWQWRGMAALAAACLGHCAVSICCVAQSPDQLAALFPDGDAYWRKTFTWIRTGVNDEYDTAYFLASHALLLVVMGLATYPSLGAVPLYHGLYQLDLMNFYVGNLTRRADNPYLALAVGWHTWSILRGIGFLFLTFEIASLSLGKMLDRPLSTSERRRRRWCCGLFFLALDVVVKYFSLDGVRQLLNSLLPSLGTEMP